MGVGKNRIFEDSIAPPGFTILSPRMGAAAAVFLCSMGMSAPAGADQVIVQDPLDGSTVGEQNGGAFVAGGWTPTSIQSWVAYDLGSEVSCGRVELRVIGLDPASTYRHYDDTPDCYGPSAPEECAVQFLSLFDAPHGSMHTASTQQEAFGALQVQADGSPLQEKVVQSICAAGWSWDGGVDTCRKDISSPMGWNANHAYTFRMQWDPSGVTTEIDGVASLSSVFAWPDDLPDPRPHFRYVFVGRNKTMGFGWLEGPVFSDVTITAVEPCADPCDGHCSNGTMDCGETGLDCGGSCSACGSDAGPDAPAIDGAPPDAAAMEAGGEASPAGDAREDASGDVLAQPDGSPADAPSEVRSDARSDVSETTPDTDAEKPGRPPSEQADGCACRLGTPGPDAGALRAWLLIALAGWGARTARKRKRSALRASARGR